MLNILQMTQIMYVTQTISNVLFVRMFNDMFKKNVNYSMVYPLQG